MWKACIILLIGFSFQRLQAQDTYNLYGKVTDSLGAPLYPSTVRLIASQDTLTTLTHEDGVFSFKILHNREFKMLISMKGYQSVDQVIAVPADQRTVKLTPLVLHEDYGDLDPAIVTRLRPITIADDTVSYHVAAFPTPDGSEVEDILKRLPGVEVDINGNVIVQGKPISKVLVDGKEFFGGDVLLAIRNLPAEVVNKLQVIDDYGGQTRLTGVKSGDPAKVLNIVLKPDKRNGEFGRVELGGSEQGKYAENIFANAFKGDRQISANAVLSNNNPAGNDPAYNGRINYANKWNEHLDGFINVSTGSQSPHSASSSLQENFYSGEQLQQTQEIQNVSHENNSSMNMLLTFKPNNYSTLLLTASGSLSRSNEQATSNFTSFQQDSGFTKSTTGQSKNSTQSTGKNLNANLYYEKLSPHSRRRFSVTVNFGMNSTYQFSNNLSIATILTDSVSSNSLLHYLVTDNVQDYNFNLTSIYFMPLGRTSFLELGYREQSNISINKIQTQQPDSANSLPIAIDSLSQDIALNSLSQSFHAGYTGQVHRLDFSAGLDAQPGRLRGTVDTKGDITSFSYFSLVPHVRISWILDKSKKLNLSYDRGPNLPYLQQLSPFTNLVNPQYPVTGNPDLKPAYTDNVYLHFEQSSLRPTQFVGYGLGAGYSITHNSIIQNLIHPKDSSQIIQATTYLNAGTTSNLHEDYHFTLPAFLNKHLRITLNGSLSRSQAINMTDNLQYITKAWAWAQSFHLQLIIPDMIETDLEGGYSLTHSVFPLSGNLPSVIKSAAIALNSRHYFFKKWILNYRFSQPYTNSGNKLQAAPCSFTASLQRQFLPRKKGTITFTGYNLFNQPVGVSQSVSPTGFSQSKSMLIGRYFLISFQFKLNHFHK
jgi:hypothetical protein